MSHLVGSLRRDAAITLLRRLRRHSEAVGVRNSGIALDVGLMLYEHGEDGLSVAEISAGSGYSGPTVRLVLARLIEAGAAGLGRRRARTRHYHLTAKGVADFDGYVHAVWHFAEAMAPALDGDARCLSAAAAPAPDRDRPAGPTPPQARYADAPSATMAVP